MKISPSLFVIPFIFIASFSGLGSAQEDAAPPVGEPKTVAVAPGFQGLRCGLRNLVHKSGYGFYDFGKNQLHRNHDWKTLETEHFFLYYYPKESEPALRAAQMVERAYARLSSFFDFDFPAGTKIPIVLYASSIDFQGQTISPTLMPEGVRAFAEGFRHRIAIPFTGSEKEYDSVVTHELVHIFQYLMGLTEGNIPLWYVEGLANFLAYRLVEGGANPAMEPWMRDGAFNENDILIPANDFRAYIFGEALWAYIAEKHGVKKILEILAETKAWGDLDEGLRSVLGVSHLDLIKEWREATRTKYYPHIGESQQPSAFAQLLTLTSRGMFSLAPSLSPDANLVAYISDKDYRPSIVVADAATGRVLGDVIQSMKSGKSESIHFSEAALSWSPDGRWLAFVGQAGRKGDVLYLYEVIREKNGIKIGKKIRHTFKDVDGLTAPSWSPDGTRMAVTVNKGGVEDLYLVTGLLEKNGKAVLTPLTQDRYTQGYPAWSPDGRAIAFATDQGPDTDLDKLVHGKSRIALLDLETRKRTFLPDQEGNNHNPQWSPDGGRIAFVSDRAGKPDVFIQDLATGALSRATNVRTSVQGATVQGPALSWSRSGGFTFTVHETPDLSKNTRVNLYALSDPGRTSVPYVPSPKTQVPPPPLPAPVSPPSQSGLELLGSVSDSSSTEAGGPLSPLKVDWETLPELREKTLTLFPTQDQIKKTGYKPKWGLTVLDNPSAGVSNYGAGGGATFIASDIVGRHNVVFGGNLEGNIKRADFLTQYYRLGDPDLGAGISQFHIPIAQAYVGGGNFLTQEWLVRSVNFLMSRPSDMFNRWDFTAQGVKIEDRLIQQNAFDVRGPQKVSDLAKHEYVKVGAARVFDNALWSSIGPVDGWRVTAQVAQAVGDLKFTEALVDARRYNLMGGSGRFSFANRALGAAAFGAKPQQYFVSGAHLFRGMDRGRLFGDKAAVVNTELRGRLVDWIAGPIPIREVWGVLFADGAYVKRTTSQGDPFGFSRARLENLDPETARTLYPQGFKSAVGFGLRVPLGPVVIHVDRVKLLGAPDPIRPDRKRGWGWSFTIGPSF